MRKRGRPPTDHTGRVYGRLTVVARGPVERNARGGRHMWVCDCECGNTNVHVQAQCLTAGDTQSCGCLRIESRRQRMQQWWRDYHDGKVTRKRQWNARAAP